MNLNNLRCFVSVVEAGSISRVAADSFVSQQALSDQIRRLEKHFGAPLLERGRPLRPTPAGQMVYDTARRVLSAVEELERGVARLREPGKRLVISTGLVWTPPFLPRLIERFREVMPETEIQLIHPGLLHERLDAPLPDADLMVGNMPFADNVEGIPLFEDRLSVAASELFLRQTLGEDWEVRFYRMGEEELRVLGLAEELAFRQRAEDKGFSQKERSMDMVAYRCRTGQAAALIPERYARETFEWDTNVRIAPLRTEELTLRVGVGFRRGTHLSESAVRFVELAQTFFR